MQIKNGSQNLMMEITNAESNKEKISNAITTITEKILIKNKQTAFIFHVVIVSFKYFKKWGKNITCSEEHVMSLNYFKTNKIQNANGLKGCTEIPT